MVSKASQDSGLFLDGNPLLRVQTKVETGIIDKIPPGARRRMTSLGSISMSEWGGTHEARTSGRVVRRAPNEKDNGCKKRVGASHIGDTHSLF